MNGVSDMKIAFMFSGQGAQFPGMMKDLCEAEPSARRVFDTANAALGRDIYALCFEGTQDELNLTHNTQPCVRRRCGPTAWSRSARQAFPWASTRRWPTPGPSI